MAVPCVIPIGPVLSILGAWLRRVRERLSRDHRNPFIKTDIKTFGFTEAHRLPTPENEAVALSQSKTAEKDYEAAKHVLVNAWLLLPSEERSEFAFTRLREGFAGLYLAKGDRQRSKRIASMPILLLDSEVQWIVTHPHEQIGGSAAGLPEEVREEKKQD